MRIHAWRIVLPLLMLCMLAPPVAAQSFPCGNWHCRMTRCKAFVDSYSCSSGEQDLGPMSCGAFFPSFQRKCCTRPTCEIKSDSYEVWEDTPYTMRVTLNDDDVTLDSNVLNDIAFDFNETVLNGEGIEISSKPKPRPR